MPKESFFVRYSTHMVVGGLILLFILTICMTIFSGPATPPNLLYPTNYTGQFSGSAITGTKEDYNYDTLGDREAPYEKDVWSHWGYDVVFQPVSDPLPLLGERQIYALAVKFKDLDTGHLALWSVIWNDPTVDTKALFAQQNFEILNYQVYLVSQINGWGEPGYNPIENDAKQIMKDWCHTYDDPANDLTCMIDYGK